MPKGIHLSEKLNSSRRPEGESDRSRPSDSRTLIGLLGYDFFVSYAWSDSRAYAEALELALRSSPNNFDVFLDTKEMGGGTELDATIRKALRRSSVLALVASRGATESNYVREEIEIFEQLGRPIIPIEVDNSIKGLSPEHLFTQLLTKRIRLEETGIAYAAASPSEVVIEGLAKSFSFLRRRRLRHLIAWGTILILMLFLGIAIERAITAETRRNRVQQELRSSKLRAYDSTLLRIQNVWKDEDALARELLNDARLCPTEFQDPTWRLYSNTLDRERHEMGAESTFNSFDISPDGNAIVAGSENGTIHYFDAETGIESFSFVAHKTSVVSVVWSPNGDLIATAAWESSSDLPGKISLWRPSSKTPLAVLEGYSPVTSLAFSPDGKLLAAGYRWGLHAPATLLIWEVERKTIYARLELEKESVGAVAFSPNGKLVASIGNKLRLWEVKARKLKWESSEHKTGIGAVAFSVDGAELASAGGFPTSASSGKNSAIRTWDVETGQQRLAIEGWDTGTYQSDRIESIAYSNDGNRIFTANVHSDRIMIWGAKSGEHLATMSTPVRQLKVHSGGLELVSCGTKGVKTWQPHTSLFRIVNSSHKEAVREICFSNNGKKMASFSSDWSIRIWDWHAKQSLELAGHGTVVKDITFSPATGLLASAGGDHCVRFWNASSGDEVFKLYVRGVDAETNRIERLLPEVSTSEISVTNWGGRNLKSIDYSPDGKLLAIGMDDLVYIWDLQESVVRRAIDTGATLVDAVFTDDSCRIVSSQVNSSNGVASIAVWSIGSGTMLAQLGDREARSSSVLELSPDGRYLATAGDESTVLIWSLENYQLVAKLDGHTDSVTDLSFSPDQRTLSSASHDKTVRLWNAELWEERATLRGHQYSVSALAFSPSGLLVSASGRSLSPAHHVAASEIFAWSTRRTKRP